MSLEGKVMMDLDFATLSNHQLYQESELLDSSSHSLIPRTTSSSPDSASRSRDYTAEETLSADEDEISSSSIGSNSDDENDKTNASSSDVMSKSTTPVPPTIMPTPTVHVTASEPDSAPIKPPTPTSTIPAPIADHRPPTPPTSSSSPRSTTLELPQQDSRQRSSSLRRPRSAQLIEKLKSISNWKNSSQEKLATGGSPTFSITHSNPIPARPSSSMRRAAASTEDSDSDDHDSIISSAPSTVTSTASTGLLGAFVKVKVSRKANMDFSRLRLVQFIAGGSSSAAPIKQVEEPVEPPRSPVTVDDRQTPTLSDNSSIFDRSDLGTDDTISGAIAVVRLSAKGNYLATGGCDKHVRVWYLSTDMAHNSPLSNIPLHFQNDKPSKPYASSMRSFRPLGSSSTAPSIASGGIPLARTGTADSSSGYSKTSSAYAKDIFSLDPVVFRGHTRCILDLSWLKHDFLLSSSLDQTVRLWHVKSTQCLAVFEHMDAVASVRFHPLDDRYFISGDNRLRLWSIQEKRVVHWVEPPRTRLDPVSNKDSTTVKEARQESEANLKTAYLATIQFPFITSVCFSRDGSLVICGTDEGTLFFYEFEGLQYNTTVELRASTRNTVGPRITGLECMPRSSQGDDKLLVTAADSRIRMYNLKDKSLIRKFRGPDLKSGAVFRASFSETGAFIICGSSNHRIYIFNTDPVASSMINKAMEKATRSDSKSRDRERASSVENRPGTNSTVIAPGSFTGVFSSLRHWQTDPSRYSQYEYFVAASDCVTSCLFANSLTIKAFNVRTGDEKLGNESVIIVATDALGNIRVFEHEGVVETLPAPVVPETTLTMSDHKSSSSSLRESPSASQELLPQAAAVARAPTQPKITTERRVITAPPGISAQLNLNRATTTKRKEETNIASDGDVCFLARRCPKATSPDSSTVAGGGSKLLKTSDSPISPIKLSLPKADVNSRKRSVSMGPTIGHSTKEKSTTEPIRRSNLLRSKRSQDHKDSDSGGPAAVNSDSTNTSSVTAATKKSIAITNRKTRSTTVSTLPSSTTNSSMESLTALGITQTSPTSRSQTPQPQDDSTSSKASTKQKAKFPHLFQHTRASSLTSIAEASAKPSTTTTSEVKDKEREDEEEVCPACGSHGFKYVKKQLRCLKCDHVIQL